MLAVVCSLLWYELLQIYHTSEGFIAAATPPKPSTDNPTSWFTERQALNLFHHRILPMLDYVQNTAIVIDNASLLDHAAFPWVLKLQMPSDPRHRMIARRTLIFGARLSPTPSSENLFVKLVTSRPYRLITRDVMKRVHERLKQVDWTVPETDEMEKKKRRKGKTKTAD
jgi:hypothetical protein